MNDCVKLSNEIHSLKQYVEQLENDKKNLQAKLEQARICVKCYECKNVNCINNIWYKS